MRLGSKDGGVCIVAEIASVYSASREIDCFQETYLSMEIIARRQKKYYILLSYSQELHNAITRLFTSR